MRDCSEVICAIAGGALLLLTTACVSADDSPGACLPNDPVLTPSMAGPGEVVRVHSDGLTTEAPCDPQLTERASYTIRVSSLTTAAKYEFEDFTPSHDGGLDVEITLPEDFPHGEAAVDIFIDGPALWCELDQSVECGRSSSLLRVGER